MYKFRRATALELVKMLLLMISQSNQALPEPSFPRAKAPAAKDRAGGSGNEYGYLFSIVGAMLHSCYKDC